MDKKHFIIKKILILWLFLLSSGCAQDKTIDILKNTVINYNKILAEGYKNLNMTPLLQVTTPEHAQKAYHHMSAIGEEGTKMIATLKHIVFSDIKIISPDRAEVKTKEEWDYTHIKISTGETVSQNSIIYELTYKLVKASNRWLVSEIAINEEKQ